MVFANIQQFVTSVAIGTVLTVPLSGILTLSVLFLHSTLIASYKSRSIRAVGDVEPYEMGSVDWKTFFKHTIITILPICVHVYAALPFRPRYQKTGILTLPDWNLLLTCIVLTLLLHDAFYFSVHRFLHTTSIRWIRKIHDQHHMKVVHKKGMLCTDLMTINPIEYWFTIMPAYSLCFELFHRLPDANFLAWLISATVAVLIAETGYSNMDVPLIILDSLGFAKISDHSMHQHDPSHNYGIYFTILDRVFGTYEPYAKDPSRSPSRYNSRSVTRSSSFRKSSRRSFRSIMWDKEVLVAEAQKSGMSGGQLDTITADSSTTNSETGDVDQPTEINAFKFPTVAEEASHQKTE